MSEDWPPETDDAEQLGWSCVRCEHFVSYQYWKQWSDNDGVLDGCRHCLPRSIRFGADIYDRDRDEVQAEFKGSDPQDRGNEPAPSSSVVDSMSLGPDPVHDFEDFKADSPAALLDD